MSFDPSDLAKKSPTFCIFPWIHLYVGAGGDVKPCCLFENREDVGSLKHNSLKEIWNGEIDPSTTALPKHKVTPMNEIRLKMLNGQKVDGCANCYYAEEHTKFSRRTEINPIEKDRAASRVASTRPDGSVPEFKLTYFDVRFNNLCNQKCRTCSEDFSTLWHADNKELYARFPEIYDEAPQPKPLRFPGKSESQLMEEILPHLETANTMYFAGGEPLIQKDHYVVLDRLLELKKENVYIMYSTNFSKLSYGDRNALDYWKKFKNVNVQASLDGIGERLEYWRKGATWKNIVTNVQDLQIQCPQVKFRIVYTVSWVNLMHMAEAHRFFIENGFIKPAEDSFNANVVYGPMGHQLWNIPSWKKDKIRKVLQSHIDFIRTNYPESPSALQFENCISIMDSGPESEKETVVFLRRTEDLDIVRNEDFFKAFPEHEDLRSHFKEIKQKWSHRFLRNPQGR